MSPSIRRKFSLALDDLVAGTCSWRIWYVLGVADVRQRYRRSLLGPFWITLSLGTQAVVMGFLLAYLFRIDAHRYIPFLCIGIVIWNFISNSLMEGANCFILLGNLILQVKRPLWTYLMQVLWRNSIIFLHTIVLFGAAAFVFKIVPSATYLLIPAGLGLLLGNVAWMALAAGLLSVRFRDIPIMVQTAIPLLVWLTPVYYQPDQLGATTRMIIELNPLTHVVEVARAPFLNQVPALSSWLASIAVGVFGWLLTLALFARTRARVPFWL